MKKILLLFVIVFVSLNLHAQKKYKWMINDNSINFYDVCKEAEKYFETHEKGKGSGWKGYQRWKNENESKYAPFGVRNNIDPLFVSKAYQKISKNETSSKSLYSNAWNDLGPYRIDSISGAYSTGLGRIICSYVHKLNPQIMYIGSRSGGFWKSTDGGTNWIGTTDTLFASGVGSITAKPNNPNYVLINVQNGGNTYSHGVYKSTDGGNTWAESNFNPTNLGKGGLGSNFRINMVRFHPRVANLVFVVANDGIYRSTDNLVTWTQIASVTSNITQIDFHPTDDNLIYIYRKSGVDRNKVLRSLDQGLSFTASNTIANNNNSTGYLSVSDDCSNCIYFASTNGVWKSIDNGVNFTFLSNPPQSCLGFAVNDLDTAKMIYGYLDVEVSTDGGGNFNRVTRWSLGNTNGSGSGHQVSFNTSTNYIHADLHPAISVNGVYYVGTDGFFCKSVDNGTTWQILSQGVGIRENYSLGVSQSNHFRSISGSQDNGTSIKYQNTWIEFYGADGMEGLIHPLNDDWMIGSLQYGGRRRTKDGGITQTGVSPTGQSGSSNGGWEAPITYNPNEQMQIFNFAKDIYVSDDFGTNWDYRGNPFSGTINEAAIAENNSDIIVVSRGSNIRKSTDGGVSFSSIVGNLPGLTIKDIAFDPNDDNTILVTYNRYNNDGNKVYITHNGGTSWTNITYNLGDMPIWCGVIDHLDASNIYLGVEIGVYTKPMNGTSWSLYNPELPNSNVRELEVVNGSNTLRAAIWGRGLWEYSLVDRNDHPAIVTTRITDQPTDILPKKGVPQFVTSTISYDNTITSVYVKWSANTLAFDNVISMSNTVDSTWVSDTSFPNQFVGTKMYFKVFAVGSNGDTTETYKFMYTVRFNSATVEVKEISLASNVEIFPNPTTNIFTINLKEQIADVNIEVVNTLGEKIIVKNVKNTNEVKMNLDRFAKGVYFLKVYLNGTESVHKIIKR